MHAFVEFVKDSLHRLETPAVADIVAHALALLRPAIMARVPSPAVGRAIDLVVAELESYAKGEPSPGL